MGGFYNQAQRPASGGASASDDGGAEIHKLREELAELKRQLSKIDKDR